MTASALLDHMVVNVRFDMDRAAAAFTGLGLQLTPRGYHSLGSINHLMILDTDYLELIGLPPDGDVQRKEIAEGTVGIDGLVFKTDDVHATFARLEALDMAGDPPRSFSRPVEVNGGTSNASFSTVTVRPGVFPAGRVYFCQHHTPDLVWRNEWRVHANGAQSTEAFWVVARDADSEAARYGDLLSRAVAAGADGSAMIDLGRSRLNVASEDEYRRRFGSLALKLDGRDSMFGAITLRCADPAAVADRVGAAGGSYQVQAESGRVLVAVPEFATVLEFLD